MTSRHEVARQALAAAEAAARRSAADRAGDTAHGSGPASATAQPPRSPSGAAADIAHRDVGSHSRIPEPQEAERPARRGTHRSRRGIPEAARGQAKQNLGRGSGGLNSETDPYDTARQIVLRQLTMAPRSRAQLESKLRDREVEDDVARAVLDRMEDVGLVDDEAYAGMLVRSQRASRGLAKRALRAELRRKGLDDDTAAEALAQVTDDDEREEARRLIDKKLRTMSGLPAQTQARRLAGMLARKGYGGEMTYAVIREAIRDAPEHQRD